MNDNSITYYAVPPYGLSQLMIEVFPIVSGPRIVLLRWVMQYFVTHTLYQLSHYMNLLVNRWMVYMTLRRGERI